MQPTTAVGRYFLHFKLPNVDYFLKNPIIRIFRISRWLAVSIIPDTWSSIAHYYLRIKRRYCAMYSTSIIFKNHCHALQILVLITLYTPNSLYLFLTS